MLENIPEQNRCVHENIMVLILWISYNFILFYPNHWLWWSNFEDRTPVKKQARYHRYHSYLSGNNWARLWGLQPFSEGLNKFQQPCSERSVPRSTYSTYSTGRGAGILVLHLVLPDPRTNGGSTSALGGIKSHHYYKILQGIGYHGDPIEYKNCHVYPHHVEKYNAHS